MEKNTKTTTTKKSTIGIIIKKMYKNIHRLKRKTKQPEQIRSLVTFLLRNEWIVNVIGHSIESSRIHAHIDAVNTCYYAHICTLSHTHTHSKHSTAEQSRESHNEWVQRLSETVASSQHLNFFKSQKLMFQFKSE